MSTTKNASTVQALYDLFYFLFPSLSLSSFYPLSSSIFASLFFPSFFSPFFPVFLPSFFPYLTASIHYSAMVDISQKYGLKYWATHSYVRSFTRTAHSFAGSALLASFARSAVLTCSIARSLRSLPCLWDRE